MIYIDIPKLYKHFEVADVYDALNIIRYFRERGYYAPYRCDEPEDSEYLWEELA